MKKTRRNSPPLTESEKRGFKNTNGKIVQAFGGDATRQSTKFAPQSPKQAKKEKEIMASEKRRAAKNKLNRVSQAIMTGGGSEIVRGLISAFKMKGFSGFGNESPAKMKGDPNDMRAKVFKSGEFKDIISKKPANAAQKSFRNFKNAARPNPRGKMATGKIGRKVAGKLGGKLLGPVGAALAIKDAYGTYKDIKKGMKPGKAARKNFLGF